MAHRLLIIVCCHAGWTDVLSAWAFTDQDGTKTAAARHQLLQTVITWDCHAHCCWLPTLISLIPHPSSLIVAFSSLLGCFLPSFLLRDLHAVWLRRGVHWRPRQPPTGPANRWLIHGSCVVFGSGRDHAWLPSMCRHPPVSSPSGCQVLGCQENVRTRGYSGRHHVCALHLKALAVQLRGPPSIAAGGSARSTWYRWCQQCARMEPLSCFDGTKRSCAKSLEQRRCRRNGMCQQQQRRQQQLSLPGRCSIRDQQSDDTQANSCGCSSFAQPETVAAAGPAATSGQLMPAQEHGCWPASCDARSDSWDAAWAESELDAGSLAVLLQEDDDLLGMAEAGDSWLSGLDSLGSSQLGAAGDPPVCPQQHLLDRTNSQASSSSACTMQATPSGSGQGGLLLPPAAAGPWSGTSACHSAPPPLLQQLTCAAPQPAQALSSQAAAGPAHRAASTTWQQQQQQQQPPQQQQLAQDDSLEVAALELWLEHELRAAGMAASAGAPSTPCHNTQSQPQLDAAATWPTARPLCMNIQSQPELAVC